MDPSVGHARGVAEYIPQFREDGGAWTSIDTLAGSLQTVVHEGASLSALVEYRVLAKGGEFQEAASNLVEVSFEYPDAPEAPVMERVSVLDRTRVELVLATDPLAEEVSLYEFQRWNALDSSWIPLVPRYPANLGFPVTHVDVDRNTDEYSYRYRAVAFNGCDAAVAQSQEAETMLLRGYQSTTPGFFENSLIWTLTTGLSMGWTGTRWCGNSPTTQTLWDYRLATPRQSAKRTRTTSKTNSIRPASSVTRFLPWSSRTPPKPFKAQRPIGCV